MARYEREKEFMATLRAVGCTIGDYVGDGNGEVDATVSTPVVDGPMDADPGEERTRMRMAANVIGMIAVLF